MTKKTEIKWLSESVAHNYLSGGNVFLVIQKKRREI